MHILLGIEEIGQPDHHQEGPAKGRDGQMRLMHDAAVVLGLGRSQDQRLPGPDIGRHHHDQQRKDDPHAEDGDQDAPGQEGALPFRPHVLQLVRIHDGIVEGQRNLQHRQHAADEEDGGHARQAARRLPAQPGPKDQAEGCHDKGPTEIGQG